MINNHTHHSDQHRRRRLTPFGKVIKFFLIVVSLWFLLFIILKVKNAFANDDYNYLKTEIASQTDINELFKRREKNNSNSDPDITILYKLHISEDVVLSNTTLNDNKQFFSSIYADGKYKSLEPKITDSNYYFIFNTPHLKKASDRKNKYNENQNIPNYYFYGNELNNEILKEPKNEDPKLPFNVRMKIAADGVHTFELFLENIDRNINNSSSPVIINTDYICLINGKVYWKFANDFLYGGEEEVQPYLNSFLINAYTCFEIGLEYIEETDKYANKYYALFLYYKANTAERILKIMDEEKMNGINIDEALFQKLGETSLSCYSEAQQLFFNDFYEKEDYIQSNIQNGLKTINGYGFSN